MWPRRHCFHGRGAERVYRRPYGHTNGSFIATRLKKLKYGCKAALDATGSRRSSRAVSNSLGVSHSVPLHVLVSLETMEGKTMAIDSSIWIYQFQATMRDKDGRALVNAHVLGFLRRICKLLFYGIKPVFVFDGGAPVLKRMTIVSDGTW